VGAGQDGCNIIEQYRFDTIEQNCFACIDEDGRAGSDHRSDGSFAKFELHRTEWDRACGADCAGAAIAEPAGAGKPAAAGDGCGCPNAA
jgi:hypothetical protein